jgi:hypothetical protein
MPAAGRGGHGKNRGRDRAVPGYGGAEQRGSDQLTSWHRHPSAAHWLRAAVILMAILAATPAMALEVTLDAKVDSPARPRVHGETNLPDGTVLSVEVSPDGGGAVLARAPATVRGGAFAVGPLTVNGADLPAGDYKLAIIMEMSRQPPEVRQVVGRNGMRMEGTLTALGTSGMYVQYNAAFKVGGDAAVQASGGAGGSWAMESCRSKLVFTNRTASHAENPREITGAEADKWLADCVRDMQSVPPVPDPQ